MSVRDLEALRALEDDWNGYGARKMGEAAFAAVKSVQYCPSNRGGIILTWITKNGEVEIEFDAEGEIDSCNWCKPVASTR